MRGNGIKNRWCNPELFNFPKRPNSLFLQPQERTNSLLSFEPHLQAAAGHDSRITAPAGFMIQIYAVHVEAGTDLLNLPFVARQSFVEYLQKIHKHPSSALYFRMTWSRDKSE